MRISRGALTCFLMAGAVLAAVGTWFLVRVPRPILESEVFAGAQDTTYWSALRKYVQATGGPASYTIMWWEPSGSGGWKHEAITVARDTVAWYLDGRWRGSWGRRTRHTPTPASVLTDPRYRSTYYSPEALTAEEVRLLAAVGRPKQ